MRRFTSLTVLACLFSFPVLAAQAPPAPVQKAKYISPVKGTATIDVVTVSSNRVGKEIVTVLKVKNTSTGAINLLKVDEYWYDKDRKMVTGDQYAHKKAPIQPGEIVEITLRSPVHPGPAPVVSQTLFRHAYGEAKATKVKAFK